MKTRDKRKTSASAHYLPLSILLAILVCSCQPASFTKSYIDKEFKSAPLKKILVIATAREDRVRKLFESKCAGHLISRGVDAVPSYTLIPDLADLTREVVTQKVESRKIDGVLIALPVAKGQSETFAPRYDQNRETLFDYYASVHHKVTETGYLLEFQWMELDIRLFETVNGRLVWSGTTKEFDLNSQQLNSLIDQISVAITRELAGKGLVE